MLDSFYNCVSTLLSNQVRSIDVIAADNNNHYVLLVNPFSWKTCSPVPSLLGLTCSMKTTKRIFQFSKCIWRSTIGRCSSTHLITNWRNWSLWWCSWWQKPCNKCQQSTLGWWAAALPLMWKWFSPITSWNRPTSSWKTLQRGTLRLLKFICKRPSVRKCSPRNFARL